MPVKRQSEHRNLEEYENPSLAENEFEREQKFIEYVEVRSWSIRKATLKAEVERTRLRGYIYAFKIALNMYIISLSKIRSRILKKEQENHFPGRKRYLPQEGISNTHNEVTKRWTNHRRTGIS